MQKHITLTEKTKLKNTIKATANYTSMREGFGVYMPS